MTEVEGAVPDALLADWANNTGPGTGDATADVGAMRLADNEAVTAKWERVDAAAAADQRGDDEAGADLLALLGLTAK